MTTNLLTIDGPSTRDIDDAVWIREPGDGTTEVTVAIANVAGTVAPGSAEDLAAHAMITTKYYASGNSPMLPRPLSEDALSLWPGKDRSVLVVRMALDAECSVTSTALEIATLRSHTRLTYPQIPAILSNPDHSLHRTISQMGLLARALLCKRRAAGAMALYDLNNGWITTEEGFLRQLKDPSETMGHIIVQELMILANTEVAKWSIEWDIPILFRNHSARIATPDRGELMRQLDEATLHPIAGLETLRERVHLLLGRATYDADVHGHYGLNLPAYTHFTSPIRRYADLVTHRQIRAALRGEALPYTRNEIVAFGEHISRGLEAERVATSRVMKERDERRAERAIDARRLDGLHHKDFERVTKLEARSGNDPSPAFLEAFVRRAQSDRVSLLAMTVVVTQAPPTDAWRPLRAAIVRALSLRPTDAVSLLAQAPQVTDGWPVPTYTTSQNGEPHLAQFAAVASLSIGEREYQGRAVFHQKKLAEQWAAVALIASISGVPSPTYEVPAFDTTVATTTAVRVDDLSKDPISALQEYAQKARLAAPTYEFELSGPAHAPQVTCRAKAVGYTTETRASSKQEAKRMAASVIMDLIRGDIGVLAPDP